jgi:hypothetical protein
VLSDQSLGLDARAQDEEGLSRSVSAAVAGSDGRRAKKK